MSVAGRDLSLVGKDTSGHIVRRRLRAAGAPEVMGRAAVENTCVLGREKIALRMVRVVPLAFSPFGAFDGNVTVPVIPRKNVTGKRDVRAHGALLESTT